MRILSLRRLLPGRLVAYIGVACLALGVSTTVLAQAPAAATPTDSLPQGPAETPAARKARLDQEKLAKLEQEQKIKAEKDAKAAAKTAKAEQEQKEKADKEAKVLAAKAAKAEQEQKEKAEKEAKALAAKAVKAEKEQKEKAEMAAKATAAKAAKATQDQQAQAAEAARQDQARQAQAETAAKAAAAKAAKLEQEQQAQAVKAAKDQTTKTTQEQKTKAEKEAREAKALAAKNAKAEQEQQAKAARTAQLQAEKEKRAKIAETTPAVKTAVVKTAAVKPGVPAKAPAPKAAAASKPAVAKPKVRPEPTTVEKPRQLASPDLLRSGPMVGYATMRTVTLWAQLTRSGGAQVEYWEHGKPARRWRTDVVLATDATDYVVHMVADSVVPGKRYAYRLWIADEDRPRLRVIDRPYPLEFQSQALWQWRTDPPAVRLALGSGAYFNDSLYDRPGVPYGGEYSIFDAIAQSKPDLMLWLGDNTFYREADWDSPLSMRRRYTHSRSQKALQPLLGAVHHYAIWDDHDYGPNEADRSFALKDDALTTFKTFWANPAYGVGGSGGITGTFQWADVQFFLLDDRWNRTPNADNPAQGQYLGAAQLRWLTEALAASTATFKIVAVGGQVLNPNPEFQNYANYAAERTELLRRLTELKVPGIVFATGDRHFGELSMLDRPGLYPLYELTTSPLTAAPIERARVSDNPLRIGGTVAAERNFGLIDVSGSLNDRKLLMTLCNAKGEPIWKRELLARDLRPGASPLPPLLAVPEAAAALDGSPKPTSVARPAAVPVIRKATNRRRSR